MAEFIYKLDDKLLPISGDIQIENCLCTDEEIIRCRDCKEYNPETLKFSDGAYGSGANIVPFCDKLRRETDPNGFCSWAERKL